MAFGLLTQGQIAGRVWQDDDYDGVLSESENGLRGAAITLLDGDGAEIAQTPDPPEAANLPLIN